MVALHQALSAGVVGSDDYVDYDSDEGVQVTNESSRAVSDPYAGVFPAGLFLCHF